MKINTVEFFKNEGRIGEIDEVEDSNGEKRTKIPLENFSGYVLVDNDAPTFNNNNQ
jgi:hypothetical protein